MHQRLVTKAAVATLGAAAAGLAAIAAPTAARADMIYTYTGAPTYASRGFGQPALGASFTLDVADAAVARGGFDLTLRDGGPFVGDLADFVGFSGWGLAPMTPGGVIPRFQSFDLAFTFDPATGDILTGTVSYAGQSDQVRVSGTEALTSGAIGSDFPSCGASLDSGACTVAGSWRHVDPPSTAAAADSGAAPLPEPASISMLGAAMGLLAATMARWRRRKAV